MTSVGIASIDQKKHLLMSNGSGASIPVGAVVILKADAAGNVVDTTSTNGSNKVFGAFVEATANATTGRVLTEGKHDSLIVANGTSSIAIGDWLSTYSHAYYAKKAVTGDMVFAMALSTPTTGTATITALLVTPRLI